MKNSFCNTIDLQCICYIEEKQISLQVVNLHRTDENKFSLSVLGHNSLKKNPNKKTSNHIIMNVYKY